MGRALRWQPTGNLRILISRAVLSVLAALCCALPGLGCDTCELAMDSNPPGRQRERMREQYRTDWDRARLTSEARARQEVADRYRGQIVHGVGCEKCPYYCKLVDLRPIERDEFARQFRKMVSRRRIEDSVLPHRTS